MAEYSEVITAAVTQLQKAHGVDNSDKVEAATAALNGAVKAEYGGTDEEVQQRAEQAYLDIVYRSPRDDRGGSSRTWAFGKF